MGIRRKTQLKEDAVPTQFCFKKVKAKNRDASTKRAAAEERNNVSAV